MNIAKFLLGFPIVYFLLVISGAPLAGCSKTTTVHDTTTVTIRDTIHTKTTDTLTIRDTINSCNCNLADGLIAYYNFNGGNLNDSSGHDNNIIFNSAVKTTDRFGRANNAYLFNGSSSYMKVANSVSLNPANAITLMATFKINGYYSANCVNNQVFGKGWNDFINGFYEMRFGSTVGCNVAVD